jgi:hypothetical protein
LKYFLLQVAAVVVVLALMDLIEPLAEAVVVVLLKE